MAWCTERTSHGDVSFNLDSELAKASDSVSTPGRKSIGLQKDGKTGGGKDLKRTEKKAVRDGAQAGAQGLGSYGKSYGVVQWKQPSFGLQKDGKTVGGKDMERTEKKAVRDGAQAGAQELRSYGKSYGVVAWKQPSSDLQKDGKTVGGKDLKRTEKKAVRDGAQAGAQELRSYGKSYGVVAWKQPLAMTKVSSGQIGRGGGGAARSATVGHQHQWQQQQQRPTPQRIAEKKPSPLTGLSGNRKGSAVIVPGSSLGGCYAAGAAGIASRGAVRVRTKDNVQKTREDAKKKIEQAAREKEAKHRFVVRRSNSLRGGKDRRLCSPTPQRIAEKKPSPLTGLSGNRKGSAVIVPGSSLGGCYAAGAAGIASRGAVRVRTKDNVQKTREDAKKKIEQAAREKKVKHTFVPSPPELVTVEDSSSDEAPEEKEEGRGEGGNVMQQDAKDARAGGEGERREKDGEWCKQSPVTDWRSYDGERGDEKEGGVSTGAKSMFGTIPEFGADAVMIGSHVVASPCHMKINMGSWVTVALKIEDEDAKDTTLDIPEGDITFFGVRYEKENHLRQEQKLSRCKDKSKDKDEGDGVEAEDGKRDIGIKPAPLPEPASEISRHDTRATVEIATKASAVLVSATAPALALNQASSAAHDLAGVEGREGLVEPARAATAAAAAVIASTHFSCVRTPGEAVVHAGEETSSLSREGAVCDRGKEEGANDSIDKDNNNRCIAATAAARRRRKTSETKETPGGGAKNDGGGDGDGVEEAAGEGAASSAPSRGETDDVARGGSGRAFNGMKTARRRINATGKENADRLAAAVAGHAVGSGIASRSSSSSNNSVDDDKNVKGDREGTCSSILAPKPSVSEKELVDPSVSDAVGTVEDGDHAICTCSVAARAGKEKRVEVRHEDEEEGRQEPAEDGNLQTLGGVDFEDGGIEREQGTRAPVRKKKLQSDLTTGRTLTATVLANGSVAGEMRTNEEDGCRRKKVKDAGRKGAEAEYSSVHNSEDKGSDEFVPISVGADAATNRPACTGTLDAEENEGNGRRARNEGGQLGKGAKARSLEIEYSSVQQPDDEGSVGAEAASDLFVDLSAIAQMTSPIRRRRSARSPTRDVGNATGGENNALAAQEEGIVKAFHASRKVPATPSSRQMLKGSPSPEQRLAQMLRLADDADLHEAMARAIKSVRSSTTSPVAPVDAARSERQCTMLEEEKDVDVFASVGGRVGAEGGYTSDRSWTNARQTDAQAYEISIAERMKVGVREGGRGARRGRGKGNMSHSVVSDGSVRLSPGEKKMSGEAGDVQSPGGKAMSRRKPLALEEVHVVQAQDCSGVIAATDG